jgi:hypothetical protein
MNWYLLVSLVVVAWFWQTLAHELSHLIVGWFVEGRKPKVLIPWPHKFQGRFYFARYKNGSATKTGSASLRHMAPIFWAAIQITIVYTLLLFVPISVFVYLSPFVFCPLIDVLFWSFGYIFNRPYTDGWQLKKITEHHEQK